MNNAKNILGGITCRVLTALHKLDVMITKHEKLSQLYPRQDENLMQQQYVTHGRKIIACIRNKDEMLTKRGDC
jgi:hypothetical protein